MSTRRTFLTLLGGAAAWPLAARAQQPERMSRVGVLVNLSENDPDGQDVVAAFVRELQRLGWSGGRNVRIDTRWGAGDRERYRSLAAELVGLMPDVEGFRGTFFHNYHHGCSFHDTSWPFPSEAHVT